MQFCMHIEKDTSIIGLNLFEHFFLIYSFYKIKLNS
jgi:hypothetical protein